MCECDGGNCNYSYTDVRELNEKIDALTTRVEGIAQFFDMMATHPLVQSMAAGQAPRGIGFGFGRKRGE